MYGEATFECLRDTIVGACLPALRARGGGEDGLTFYDLGSGSGRAVFAAAMVHPFASAVGVERVPSLHALSRKLLTVYDRLFRKKLGPRWGTQTVGFELGDMTTTDFAAADIVLVHGTCYSAAQLASIGGAARRMGPGALLVSVSHNFPALQAPEGEGGAPFKLVHEREHRMSWGSGVVYVLQRTDAR